MKKSFIGFAHLLPWLVVMGCDLNPDNETSGPAADAGSAQACVSSDECFDVCDTAQSTCVKYFEATCPSGTDEECERFDGLPFCVDQQCAAEQCYTDTDCGETPAGSHCVRGQCINEAWECIGQPDERKRSQGTASYELMMLDPVSGEFPQGLEVKLCGFDDDPDCRKPPVKGSGVIELDAEKKRVRIKNLPQDTRIHLQLSSDQIFPIDFYSQRPVRGKRVVASAPIYVIPRFIAQQIQAYSSTAVDLDDSATVLGRILDCQDVLAAGVTLSSSRERTNGNFPTAYFFLQSGNIADADLTATSDYGIAGIANLVPDKPTTLTVSLGERDVTSFKVTPQKGWLTYVHFYPWDYGK